jgi:hypothetical protein
MRTPSTLFAVVLLSFSATLFAAVPASDDTPLAAFSITQKTQIPGEVLKPGDYTIQIVDHISDRIIVEVDGSSNKQHSVFLGVPSRDIDSTKPGTVDWGRGPNSIRALRGFTFPSGTTVEFVWPKAQAAALAQLNKAQVIAIDPESEGRPNLKNFSADDRKEISLWLLSLTTTGPDNRTPAMEARRYTGATDVSVPVVAHNTQPSDSKTPVQVATLDRPALPGVTHGTQVRRTPVVAVLPHTASALPMIGVSGIFLLLAGGLLTLRQRMVSDPQSQPASDN